MTLDQLRYFQATAQLGSFSKAAEREHISQPSLSIAIKKLEKELGMSLFQENRKRAILTPAGQVFLQDIDLVFEQLDVAITHMAQFAEADRGEIRLAYTDSVSEVYVPRLLQAFLTEEGKGCCIYSDEMPTDRIEQGIKDGRFDLGIGSLLPVDPEIEKIPIAYQELCLLLPKGMDKENFVENPNALNDVPFIHFRKDYPMYRLLSEKIEEWKATPHVIQYTYSENAIARLVEKGLGVGIVAEIEGLNLHDLQIVKPQWLEGGRYIYLIRHRTRRGTNASLQLQKRILEESSIK